MRLFYKIDYPQGRDGLAGAKTRCPAGWRVRFRFTQVGTDTDYSFYADGKKLNALYRRGRGYVISFVMPAHDTVFTYSASSSMDPAADNE